MRSETKATVLVLGIVCLVIAGIVALVVTWAPDSQTISDGVDKMILFRFRRGELELTGWGAIVLLGFGWLLWRLRKKSDG